MRSKRGFINILIVLLLLAITFTGVWGIEYLRRINAEKKFRQNVDQLTLSAASIQAMGMNGVAILNDGIILSDGVAALVAVSSTVVGIITIIVGVGFEIIKDGLQLSKKILDVGNKIKDLEKKWVEISPVLIYIPYISMYSKKLEELRDTHVLYLPVPLIPTFSEDGSNYSNEEESTLALKLHITWNIDASVKGLLKQVLYYLDDFVKKTEKNNEKRYKKKIERVKNKYCGNVKLCRSGIEGLIGTNSLFFKGLRKLIVSGWNKGFQKLVSGVDKLNLGSSNRLFGVEIPVPAAIEKGFFKVQKVGTLGIWKVGTFTPIKWLRYGGFSEKIPVEVMFSRAMPYSRIIDGGVPIMPDWKAVFVPPDLLNALGIKSEKR